MVNISELSSQAHLEFKRFTSELGGGRSPNPHGDLVEDDGVPTRQSGQTDETALTRESRAPRLTVGRGAAVVRVDAGWRGQEKTAAAADSGSPAVCARGATSRDNGSIAAV